MIKALTTTKNIRTTIIKIIEGLSNEQLNAVPPGFNNNIIWNVIHLISAQQSVCYTRSGLDVVVDDKYVSPYKPGTKPEAIVTDTEVEKVKGLLLSSIDVLDADYQVKDLSKYNAVTTRYGVELASVDDAISFLPFHDGLHMGYIMALKRLV